MKILILLMLCFSFTANANKIYKKKCLRCHGRKGEGMYGQKAPKIAGQHYWYLKNQIKLIRDKKRTSGYSKRMYPFVKRLTDKEIEEVSKYLEGLK